MRIVRYVNFDGVSCWGRWVDAAHAVPMEGELLGEHHFTGEPQRIDRRLPPVDPPNIIAIGRNYSEHAREMKAESIPDEPLIFLKATTSVIGPNDAIVLPRSAPDEVDFEAELAVIIAATAKDVCEERALEYVFGYTCANDVSARDCQKRRDRQWARGKSFDTFCPLGPVLVTKDEGPPDGREIRSILNGHVMQDGNTSDMIFSVPFLVSYLSRQFTLRPGTVILTGTPSGVGAARSPQVFLRAGDEIAVEIDGIGRLSNPVKRFSP
ncbi:MAG: fumarylacetoacetate hydrolase family protein [Phycisphaerae bacterium]